MNVVEQYDAHNSYYALDVIETKGVQGLRFDSEDNNIYKTKVDFGDGVIRNGTGFIGSGYSVGTSSKTYSDYFTGKIKIYNNPKKIKKMVIDFGLDGHSSDPDYLTVKNVVLTPEILDHFPNADYFFFNHYSYGSVHSSLKGKVTGEWATKCGDKLKELHLHNIDYPNTDATFNLNLIPSNSILETLNVGGGNFYSTTNVTGDLSYIPSTCKRIYFSQSRSSNSNITGMIPSFAEEIRITARNTIKSDISKINPSSIRCHIDGQNEVFGTLPALPNIDLLRIGGANTIMGELSGINPNITDTVSITGQNRISGTLPNFPMLSTILEIGGYNSLEGSIPRFPKLKNLSISGNNILNGHVDLPETLVINLGGQNEISSMNLPKIVNLTVSGNNTISGDLSTPINTDASTIIIKGKNKVSSISGTFDRCVTFSIEGFNELSGDLLSKIPNAESITIGGNNQITYSSRSFPAKMNRVEIRGRAALTAAMVKQLLKDLDSSTTSWSGSNPTIIIKGNSQKPAEEEIVQLIKSLIAKGVKTISTN